MSTPLREPERVKLVASEENTGIAGAFNRALDAHTGDYIAWLGGDDVMLPGKLSRQIAALELTLRPSAVAMTLRSSTRSQAGRTAASRRCTTAVGASATVGSSCCSTRVT